MTGNTANLQLPFLAVGQAQKHVTLNESLRRLDALVQLNLVSATTTAQPGSPGDGEVWIVPSGKTGAQWASFTDWALGYYRDGAWEQISPREGWLAWVKDTGVMLVYTGASWSTAAIRTGLGLGTAAEKNTGTSGEAVPLLNNASNTWSGTSHVFQATGGSMGVTVRGDAACSVNYERSGDTSGAPIFNLQKSRGAMSSRTDVAANDTLGTFTFAGYGGGGFRSGAQIAASVIAATPSATDMQSEIVALTSASGSVSPAARLRIRATVVRPGADNAQTLGDASFRWSEVFAANGTINTSDAREKTTLRALLPAEIRAVKRILGGIGVFQWLASVERKGNEARLHIGVTAQAVADGFAAEGLDARRYGLFCVDAVEGGERFGVRHDQLFALALAMLAA
jgi:hypothetical protein